MIKALMTAALAVFVCVGCATALKCNTRTGSSSLGDGTSVNCTTDTTCFTYVITTLNYAGCGNCSGISSDYGCTTCSTDNCNTQPSINCNYVAGIGSLSTATKTTCYGSKTCYTYNIGSLYYGGCGNCYSYSTSYSCKTCATDYCNSSPLTAAGSMKVAAAGVMLLLLMKLL